MNILVSFKENYGKELFYPQNEDAKFLAEFTGRPTLLKRQLKMALDRGWKVSVIQEPFNLDKCLNSSKNKDMKSE